jgi:DNA (cytosine-5)-methyltransferase 1
MTRHNSTVASLFAGLGGLDRGFELAGFDVVWANEISANAAASYEANFGRAPVCADIGNIDMRDIPDSDVIIGGPPCQSFSLVGQRRQGDERGRLVFQFRDIVLAKRPRAFVMENVPGMTSSRLKEERLPDLLAREFSKAGYYVSVYKLTATDYLVPQRRSRIFILGNFDRPIERPDPERFLAENYGVSPVEADISARAAIDDLGSPAPKGELSCYKKRPQSMLASLLREGNGDKVSLHEIPRMSAKDSEFVKHLPPGGNYRDIPDSIATYGRLHPDEPAYTINTYFRRPNVGCNFHYSEARLITAREAMRFQCFPDRFQVIYNSQDERNAYIGNAVPPFLGQAVAWALRKSLRGRSARK